MSGLNPNIIMNLIPNGWEVIALKYVVDYNKDTLSEDTAPCFEFDYVDIGSVTYGKGIEQFQRMVFREAPSRARRKVKTNDVILSTVRTYLKAVASIPERDVQVVVSTGFLAMSAKKRVVPRFLFYAVQSDYFVDTIEANSYGISYPAINSSTAVSCKILLPPLEEQQAIASYLDDRCSKLDEIIIEAEKSIEEYKELKQAVIYESITGKKSNQDFDDSGSSVIGRIPLGWRKVRIKDISSRITVGVVVTPASYFDNNGTVPFLRGINVKEYVINDNPMVYITEETNRVLLKTVVHTNDLVVVRDGAIGVTAVVPEKYDGANVVSMIIVTPNENCNSDYLCYVMNSQIGKVQFDLTKIGAALTHTSVKAVSNIEIPFPPLVEQVDIVKYLNQRKVQIDSLISEKQSLIEDLKAYKKSLIYEVVTGKRRVV